MFGSRLNVSPGSICLPGKPYIPKSAGCAAYLIPLKLNQAHFEQGVLFAGLLGAYIKCPAEVISRDKIPTIQIIKIQKILLFLRNNYNSTIVHLQAPWRLGGLITRKVL